MEAVDLEDDVEGLETHAKRDQSWNLMTWRWYSYPQKPDKGCAGKTQKKYENPA